MPPLQPILNFLHEWVDAWVMLTVVGSIALAVATFRVILQGRQLRKASERQHRNRFKPICLLAPQGGVDACNWGGEFLEAISPAPDNPSCGTVAIRCVLRNVGTGPPLKLRLNYGSWT